MWWSRSPSQSPCFSVLVLPPRKGSYFLPTGKSFLLTVGLWLLTVNWLGLFYLRLQFGLVFLTYSGKSVWSFLLTGPPCPEIRFGLFLLTVPPVRKLGDLFCLRFLHRKKADEL